MEKTHSKAVWIFFFQFIFAGLFLFVFLGIPLTSLVLPALFSGTSSFAQLILRGITLFVIPIVLYLTLCYILAELAYNRISRVFSLGGEEEEEKEKK